jgi:hypothetical protein
MIYTKPGLDRLWAKMFRKVLASAGPVGLYLKRQPWNFHHPQIVIPRTRFTSVQRISGTQHVTETAGRRLGFPGQKFREQMPKVVTGVLNKLAGDIVELRLSDPSVRIDLLPDAVGSWEQYAAPKPKAPVPKPSSPVVVA